MRYLILFLLAAGLQAAEPIKIGFLVKQAEEPWFQDEWRFAEQAAKEKGFTLVKIGIPNGESASCGDLSVISSMLSG